MRLIILSCLFLSLIGCTIKNSNTQVESEKETTKNVSARVIDKFRTFTDGGRPFFWVVYKMPDSTIDRMWSRDLTDYYTHEIGDTITVELTENE